MCKKVTLASSYSFINNNSVVRNDEIMDNVTVKKTNIPWWQEIVKYAVEEFDKHQSVGLCNHLIMCKYSLDFIEKMKSSSLERFRIVLGSVDYVEFEITGIKLTKITQEVNGISTDYEVYKLVDGEYIIYKIENKLDIRNCSCIVLNDGAELNSKCSEIPAMLWTQLYIALRMDAEGETCNSA